jgi:hypothetical protein
MRQDNDFLKDDETNVPVAMQQLTALMPSVTAKYKTLTSVELLQPPAPGKWSRQQVLGHLIDSAINNLKRFTDAQLLEQPYLVIGYKQDGLMLVNRYQEQPLSHLLTLWQALNRQIVFVVSNIPHDELDSLKVQNSSNTQSGTQTLAWLICDYVAHMKHHLQAAALLN